MGCELSPHLGLPDTKYKGLRHNVPALKSIADEVLQDPARWLPRNYREALPSFQNG